MNTLLSNIVYILVKMLNSTYRYKYIDQQKLENQLNLHNEKIYILGTWHQNLFAGILAFVGKNTHCALVSKSKDGDLVANAIEKFGHKVARGSSKKAGGQGKEELMKLMRMGYPAAITMDGPLGPAKKIKPGIIDIAQNLGCFIIPYLALPKDYWILSKTWDQFRIPKPFSEVYIRFGEGIKVPVDLKFEEFDSVRDKITKSLEQLESQTVLLIKNSKGQGTSCPPTQDVN